MTCLYDFILWLVFVCIGCIWMDTWLYDISMLCPCEPFKIYFLIFFLIIYYLDYWELWTIRETDQPVLVFHEIEQKHINTWYFWWLPGTSLYHLAPLVSLVSLVRYSKPVPGWRMATIPLSRRRINRINPRWELRERWGERPRWWSSIQYPLVNSHITMENHHVQWKKSTINGHVP